MKIIKKQNKIMFFVIAIFLLLSGCQNSNSEIESLKKENEQLKQQIEELTKNNPKTDIINNDNSKFNAKFENDNTPMKFGNSEQTAEIKNVSIVFTPESNEYLLKIDFHFYNNSKKSANFINSQYCNVIAYQKGIELDSTGFTSEQNIYDTNNSYKNIKNTDIDTQLVFVLNDTESPVELELGSEYYKTLITKKVIISKK